MANACSVQSQRYGEGFEVVGEASICDKQRRTEKPRRRILGHRASAGEMIGRPPAAWLQSLLCGALRVGMGGRNAHWPRQRIAQSKGWSAHVRHAEHAAARTTANSDRSSSSNGHSTRWLTRKL